MPWSRQHPNAGFLYLYDDQGAGRQTVGWVKRSGTHRAPAFHMSPWPLGGFRCASPNRKSVRVSADATADWLVAEFTMPTEAQYKALPKIERAIKFHAWNRWDSTFSFPFTEAERARAARKAGRRKTRTGK